MNIKKIIAIITIAIIATALSGCKFLDDLRASILRKGEETVDTVTQKAKEVSDQIKKTKDQIEQKVQDVQNAVKEVNEAVDAVKKVTDGATGGNTGTNTAK